MSGSHSMSRELDQVMCQYRDRLRRVASLWTQATQLRLCDVTMSKSTEELVSRLEGAVAGVMEREVKVEKSRQAVLNLGLVLDVSRQTVETKSQHLTQEEMQKEEAQNVRFREFQKIHKLQAEKLAIEKEIIPAKTKLQYVTETLQEKNEKMRNLERFHSLLSSHCARDMLQLKDQTDLARQQRPLWDKVTTGGIGEEVQNFALDKSMLQEMGATVSALQADLQNYRQWHEEELQTKLFLSTRSKEIKHRLAHFRNLLHRLERTSCSDAGDDEPKEKAGQLSRQSDNLLVDGSPGVQAKEVEQYLSHQLGMRVMADYTMLKRLKEEIGVPGLAYLVEKIRLQGGVQASPLMSPSPACWEEKRVHQALLNIALEYREQDENRSLMEVSGLNLSSDSLATNDDTVRLPYNACVQGRVDRAESPSNTSQSSRDTGHSSATDRGSLSEASRRGSVGQLRRKNSFARIKKLLKF